MRGDKLFRAILEQIDQEQSKVNQIRKMIDLINLYFFDGLVEKFPVSFAYRNKNVFVEDKKDFIIVNLNKENHEILGDIIEVMAERLNDKFSKGNPQKKGTKCLISYLKDEQYLSLGYYYGQLYYKDGENKFKKKAIDFFTKNVKYSDDPKSWLPLITFYKLADKEDTLALSEWVNGVKPHFNLSENYKNVGKGDEKEKELVRLLFHYNKTDQIKDMYAFYEQFENGLTKLFKMKKPKDNGVSGLIRKLASKEDMKL